MSDWQKFKKQGIGAVTPTITIYQDGRMSASMAAIKMLGSEHFELYYNKKTFQIGLIGVKNPTEYSFSFKKYPTQTKWIVSINIFLLTFDLKGYKWNPRPTEIKDDFLVIDLA